MLHASIDYIVVNGFHMMLPCAKKVELFLYKFNQIPHMMVHIVTITVSNLDEEMVIKSHPSEGMSSGKFSVRRSKQTPAPKRRA